LQNSGVYWQAEPDKELEVGVWDSWVAMGLIAAAAWALSCVFDVCLIGKGIYREPMDGPLVAGLFCVVPLFSLQSWEPAMQVSPPVGAVAILAGIFYLLHVYYNFRALFALNDATNAEIFNSLSILVVPVIAFLAFGEVLQSVHYLAIGLSLIGVLVLMRFQLATLTTQVALHLGISVLFVSLMMVMQAWVLEFVAYDVAILLFSLSAFVPMAAVLALKTGLWRRVRRLGVPFGAILIAVQLLELGGVLGSQRATDVGPSVSLVALLECSLPIFVMLFSWLLLAALRRWRVPDSQRYQSVLHSQSDAYPAKLASLALIVVAIGLVQL
jgi:hypothetical protein